MPRKKPETQTPDTAETPAEATTLEAEPQGTLDPQIQQLLEQNERLTRQIVEMAAKNQQLGAALQGVHAQSRALPQATEPTCEVVCVAGCSVSFRITDSKGNPKDVFLPGRGSRYTLTHEQVRELKEVDENLFEGTQPLLMVSGEEQGEANPNAVASIPRFLAGLGLSAIQDRIQAIDNVPLLYEIYHHIESTRFVTTDERGAPLFHEEDGVKIPTIREVPIEPRVALIEQEVARRVQELTGVRLSIDSGE